MLLSTSLVTEHFRPFSKLPIGALFLVEGQCYWKLGPTTALTLGLSLVQERAFDLGATVCHLVF